MHGSDQIEPPYCRSRTKQLLRALIAVTALGIWLYQSAPAFAVEQGSVTADHQKIACLQTIDPAAAKAINSLGTDRSESKPFVFDGDPHEAGASILNLFVKLDRCWFMLWPEKATTKAVSELSGPSELLKKRSEDWPKKFGDKVPVHLVVHLAQEHVETLLLVQRVYWRVGENILQDDDLDWKTASRKELIDELAKFKSMYAKAIVAMQKIDGHFEYERKKISRIFRIAGAKQGYRSGILRHVAHYLRLRRKKIRESNEIQIDIANQSMIAVSVLIEEFGRYRVNDSGDLQFDNSAAGERYRRATREKDVSKN